jgi:hypothetical protein
MQLLGPLTRWTVQPPAPLVVARQTLSHIGDREECCDHPANTKAGHHFTVMPRLFGCAPRELKHPRATKSLGSQQLLALETPTQRGYLGLLWGFRGVSLADYSANSYCNCASNL